MNIKTKCIEKIFAGKCEKLRSEEISNLENFCLINFACKAIYVNSGVILSSILFLTVDRTSLELGKVMSTLSLLGYIFGYSIV